MAELDLELVRSRLAERLAGFDRWDVHLADDQVSLEGPGPWSPHPWKPEAMVDLIVEGILSAAWSSHCQYLAMLFGEERTGCVPADE